MSDEVRKIVQGLRLPRNLADQSAAAGLTVLDGMLAGRTERDIFALSFLRQVRTEVGQILSRGYAVAKMGVLVPAGLWGLSGGLSAPDLDIDLLGIGNHRFFFFHSALGLVVLRHLYGHWQTRIGDSESFGARVVRKLSGAALGSYAVGVGIHLAIDVVQPKSVVFPFFGSLVNGTLIDDRLWLLGNSLWAFQIGRNLFALCLADEIEAARAFVSERLFPLGQRFAAEDIS